MAMFSFYFLETLLHSLWQSALLWFIYITCRKFFTGNTPYYNRNLLLIFLAMQCVASVCTFYIISLDNAPNIFQELFVTTINYNRLNIASFILMIGYCCVVVFKFSKLLIEFLMFRKAFQQSIQAPAMRFNNFVKIKALQLKIKKKIRLLYSNCTATPVTFGFFKPVILLPISLMTQLSPSEVEMLIMHELNHIKNNDYVLNFFVIFCDTLFFFNPFTRLIAEAIKLEREKQCDINVVAQTYSKIAYAEVLVKAARFKIAEHSFQMNAVSKQTILLKRVLFFTRSFDTGAKTNFKALPYLFALLILIGSLFVAKQFKIEQKHSIVSKNKGLENLSLISSPVVRNEEPKKIITSPVFKSITKNDFKKSTPKSKSKKVLLEDVIESTEPPQAIFASESNTDIEVDEFIIHEEQSGNKPSSTKVYRVAFVNGKWQVELTISYTETKPAKDSCEGKRDSIPRLQIIQ
ncbi:MAG: M56 family metallopeptidase [Ferruginibacter sp.]